MKLAELLRLVEDNDIRTVDLKYCDLVGRWYHISFPARRLEKVMQSGIPFDGSSIPGMQSVESGDMVLMPDISTASLDYLAGVPNLRIICSICDAENRVGVKKDPKSVAQRAQAYLEKTGIADESLWIPELEFYLFDEADYYNDKFVAGYEFSSAENKKCLPLDFDDSKSVSQSDRKGYHMDTPYDQFFHVREEMVELMEELGIKIRYHHHEVGLASQQEMETELLPFPRISDEIMFMKDIIRRVALEHNLTATFMPKPLYNEPGNGMHYHIMLRNNGKNIFYKEGNYADLSDEALYFVGGILKHGKSLTAFTNPSTNSFKRLLPGFEAPVKLFFGLANRSAAIRIPKYANEPESKRIEFRTGDACANPYLTLSALLMAGLDGIKNKIDPSEHGFGPHDDNVFNWPEEKQEKLEAIPTSLEDALEELRKDHDYLLHGGVFNKELIESWIKLKSKEAEAVRNRPHPYEMNLYYGV
jgi:glutamine synthetase